MAGSREFASMPSLIRLLMVVGLLGGVAYGAMFALANFVQPKQREMSITIPAQQPHQAELSPLRERVCPPAGGKVARCAKRWRVGALRIA